MSLHCLLDWQCGWVLAVGFWTSRGGKMVLPWEQLSLGEIRIQWNATLSIGCKRRYGMTVIWSLTVMHDDEHEATDRASYWELHQTNVWFFRESVEMNNPEWFCGRDQEALNFQSPVGGDKMGPGRATNRCCVPDERTPFPRQHILTSLHAAPWVRRDKKIWVSPVNAD